MSREPLPPRPEKESFDVSEGLREPSADGGFDRRVADRTVDGTGPLQRALAGLTTAGEWAAQAEAEERAATVGHGEAEPASDAASAELHEEAASDPVDETPELPPRQRARQQKAEARQARRAAKQARRADRDSTPKTATEVRELPGADDDDQPEVEDQSEITAVDDEGVVGEADSTLETDPQGEESAAADEPLSGTRSHRSTAKQARRAAALERRRARAEAKIHREGRRAPEVSAPSASNPVDETTIEDEPSTQPDEIDRERTEAERTEAERTEAERTEAGQAEAVDDTETDWEDVERRAAEAAVAVSARAAARQEKATERARHIEAKAAARLERSRARRGAAPIDDVPEPPDVSRGSRRTPALAILAAVVGAAGLILSVVLAVGAFLAALGTDSGTLYSVVSGICDALTAPIAGFVDFDGANAEQKTALVVWGLGAIIYLAVGLAAQSLLRSRTDTD